MAGDWDEPTNAVEVGERARPAGAGRAALIVLQGTNVGESYPINEPTTIGRGAGADLRITDEGVSRFQCKVTPTLGGAYVEDLGSRNGTFVNGVRLSEPLVLKENDKIQVGSNTILRFTIHDRVDETYQRQMLDAALRDPLTGAYNKRYLVDRLASEVRFALRHRSPLSLAMFDLDNFKKVNDGFGHLIGDRVLVEFASLIQGSIRTEDVLARFGGEEFALISRAVSPADFFKVADRLRTTIAARPVETDSGPLRYTVSIGVASLDNLRIETATDLLAAADAALYQAKRDGRNRVVECTPDLVARPTVGQ